MCCQVACNQEITNVSRGPEFGTPSCSEVIGIQPIAACLLEKDRLA